MKTNIQENFEKAIAPFNPVKPVNGSYDWEIQTVVGPLVISFHNDDSPWIACRFMDVPKANKYFDGSNMRFNLYTGKWNWLAYEFWPLKGKIPASLMKNVCQKMFDTLAVRLRCIYCKI